MSTLINLSLGFLVAFTWAGIDRIVHPPAPPDVALKTLLLENPGLKAAVDGGLQMPIGIEDRRVPADRVVVFVQKDSLFIGEKRLAVPGGDPQNLEWPALDAFLTERPPGKMVTVAIDASVPYRTVARVIYMLGRHGGHQPDLLVVGAVRKGSPAPESGSAGSGSAGSGDADPARR